MFMHQLSHTGHANIVWVHVIDFCCHILRSGLTDFIMVDFYQENCTILPSYDYLVW